MQDAPETTAIEISDERLNEFTEEYYNRINYLRTLDITDATIKEYSELPLNMARMLVGENLFEASFALQKIHPDMGEILFKIANGFIADNQKDFRIQEKMDIILEEDDNLKKLFNELTGTGDLPESDED